MATPARFGDGIVLAINPEIANGSGNDENANHNMSSPNRSSQSKPPLSPTSPSKSPTKDTMIGSDNNTVTSSVYFTASGSNSANDYSIDKYETMTSMDNLVIEQSNTDRLEEMMTKFDEAVADSFEEKEEPVSQEEEAETKSEEPLSPPRPKAIVIPSETPKALTRMMHKFDMLKTSSIDEPEQDLMMAKFDLLQQSVIADAVEVELTKDDDARVYRDASLTSLASSDNGNCNGDIDDSKNLADPPFNSYSTTSYCTNDIFADIEQFRSADSHGNHSPPSTFQKESVLEQRVAKLMNQVSKLELEKDELRAAKDKLQSSKDELQSQVQAQQHEKHTEDVQDMYQNPYSNPFVATAPPMTMTMAPKDASGHFRVTNSTSMGAVRSGSFSVDATNGTELTELRMRNQALQNDLDTSDRVKERLKKVLKTVQEEDQQKADLLAATKKELSLAKQQNTGLRKELDACKVRLEGFEMAQTPNNNSKSSSDPKNNQTQSKAKARSTKSEHRKSFFSSSSSEPQNQNTGDVATALVVSHKQNEALEAFNKELALQNTQLQKKCDSLNEKYGLSTPHAGDDKGTQLYSRYLEMKSSLSGLSVVLEEAQEQNSQLTQKVVDLTTELTEQHQHQQQETEPQTSDNHNDSNVAVAAPISPKNAITAEQEETLKGLVEKLEVQILEYREAERLHGIIHAELETTVDGLENEASALRQELEETKNSQNDSTSPESQKQELVSLKATMEKAAKESNKVLDEMETLLASTQKELQDMVTKYKDLHEKYEVLSKTTADQVDDAGNTAAATATTTTSTTNETASSELQNPEQLLKENETLHASIVSLQTQTKKLNRELKHKTSKVEKSEKRVSAKHEKLLELNKANASLRDGIQKLKGHLSTISEQVGKTEASLAITKEALGAERETSETLKVANITLEHKLGVLQTSIEQSHDFDEAASANLELTASLAASSKELSLEKDRVQKLVSEKKELECALDATEEDLRTRLHTQNQTNVTFDVEISAMEIELYGAKLIVAAATQKMAAMDEMNSKRNTKLQEVLKTSEELSKERIQEQEVLKNTMELLSAERAKVEELNGTRSAAESKLDDMRLRVKALQSSNAKLVEAMKQKPSSEAAESTHQFAELEKLLATTQNELNEEEKQVESLEKQVDRLTLQIQELEKCKSDLAVSLDSVKQEMIIVSAKNLELESLQQGEKVVNDKLLGSGKEKAKHGVTKKLESLIHHLQSTESQNAELKSTLEEERKCSKIAELETAKKALSIERKNAASLDVRFWEAEMLLGNTKKELTTALKQNEELAGKVNNLESSVEKSQLTNTQTLMECETHVEINNEMAIKIGSLETEIASLEMEKESLLKRTAAMARRDQIQKESITKSNDEIEKLTGSMVQFQIRFETLAQQVNKGGAENRAQAKEHEEAEVRWISETHELVETIANLRKKLDELQAKFDSLDSKHVRALMNEESDWQKERIELNSRIALLEKDDDSKSATANYDVFPLRKCDTDRSLLNQTVCELEQDLQLQEITMNDTKQVHLLAAAELEVTKYKLVACEEELEVLRPELETSRAEFQALVLKSATDHASFNGYIQELKENLESTKQERDFVSMEHDVTKTVLEASEQRLEQSHKTLLVREIRIQEIESVIEREDELRVKHEACLEDLKSCKKSLEAFKTAEAAELNTAIEKQQELQSKYDSCVKELDSCKKDSIEKDQVMKELAKKQVRQQLEQQEENKGIQKNTKALELLADELNEAHIRENALEEMLSSCQDELSITRKKLDAFQKEIIDEKYGGEVYKSVITKLNRTNDSLTKKNKKLVEEIETHKASTASLEKEVDNLKQENEIARVVTSGINCKSDNNISNITTTDIEKQNLMMMDLLKKSQLSVTEAKHMQKILSKQVQSATKRETKLTKEVLKLKSRHVEMAKRLEEQEQELDEFENDFALARNDARKVVEELRSQLTGLEKRNKKLEATTGLASIEDLHTKLKQLVLKNKRLEKEIDNCKTRERRLESELGLEPRRCR